MNQINVGLSKKIRYPNGGFLLIDDKVRRIKPRHPHEAVRVFDHKKHSFNPLKNLDYRRARDFLAVINAAFPEGENTLTRKNATFTYFV